MKLSREELVSNLEDVRTNHGDEAYYKARHALALMLVTSEHGRTFLRETFSDLDVDAVIREAEHNRTSTDQDLFRMMQLQVPNMKTQAQFDAYRLAFEALSVASNCYFAGDNGSAERAREALDQAMDAVREASFFTQKAEVIPAEDRSDRVAELMQPPKEFQEVEEQRRLLAELDAIDDAETLNTWYQESRKRMEVVVSQPYRNELFDAIREKQGKLAN